MLPKDLLVDLEKGDEKRVMEMVVAKESATNSSSMNFQDLWAQALNLVLNQGGS